MKKISCTTLPVLIAIASFAASNAYRAESKLLETDAKSTPPNIILILADDAGYADFGFYHEADEAPFKKITPALDRLIEQGAFFNNAYVSASVCGPSRAGLITGRYQQRFGWYQNEPNYWSKPPHPDWQSDDWKVFGLDVAEETIGDHLKASGYTTGIIGKWHLGYGEEHYPNIRGFDYFFGMRGGARDYFSRPQYNTTERIPFNWRSLEEDGKIFPEEHTYYVTDLLTDKGIQFIEANKDRPFFLFISHIAPHSPMQADSARLDRAKELFPDADINRQKLVAMTLAMDEGIGQVMDKLEELALSERTLVVFLNDNGGSTHNHTDNGKLRGYKWSPYEGGLRVPMAFYWKEKIPAQVIDTPVISLDLTPTFLELAGQTDTSAKALDGTSLLPVLLEGESLPQRPLFWKERNREGWTSIVRLGDWKLIDYDNKRKALYNLTEDIGEKYNQITEKPQIAQKLSELLDDWEAITATPRWPIN
ncbi:sulfatase-like hydrolase/transferase [Rubellicoccus peritrichatus]|uniref:Sulfatase-like hydrolase/transferase n=1 Tax=Rubellicoccus peritrichatus TaxID=3080537 RepID=A0AAQ3QX75_9BACT|nr:sulfatase-like hydrolase/transferase [Puniceicoccus sp. CR14]WOO42600.1 sulfatase-like hydrolase/transferase [Puniceicoccus sp. CR14]